MGSSNICSNKPSISNKPSAIQSATDSPQLDDNPELWPKPRFGPSKQLNKSTAVLYYIRYTYKRSNFKKILFYHFDFFYTKYIETKSAV